MGERGPRACAAAVEAEEGESRALLLLLLLLAASSSASAAALGWKTRAAGSMAGPSQGRRLASHLEDIVALVEEEEEEKEEKEVDKEAEGARLLWERPRLLTRLLLLLLLGCLGERAPGAGCLPLGVREVGAGGAAAAALLLAAGTSRVPRCTSCGMAGWLLL